MEHFNPGERISNLRISRYFLEPTRQIFRRLCLALRHNRGASHISPYFRNGRKEDALVKFRCSYFSSARILALFPRFCSIFPFSLLTGLQMTFRIFVLSSLHLQIIKWEYISYYKSDKYLIRTFSNVSQQLGC